MSSPPIPKPGERGFKKHSHPTQAQSYDEVLASDSRPIPDFISYPLMEDLEGVGPSQVPVRWYLDSEIHKRERERIWKRRWHMACRLDHVAAVGDTYVHDIAGMSFIIVRAEEDKVKGYWNSCLHRGLPIRQRSGRVERLQCPYHGFTWSLNGECQLLPFGEQFPQIDKDNFTLPEVQVAVWQGFVFINPDPDAEPLDSYMGGFADQFQRWPYTDRQLSAHITKVFPCNWKAVQEAFNESFHVLTTHPQYAATGAERCSAYGMDGNFSRGVAPIGYTDDFVPDTPEEELIWLRMNDIWDDEEVPENLHLPPGVTAREAIAERNRGALRPILGQTVDDATDTEIVDVHYWTLFPNFQPLGHFTGRVDRFYPHLDDPNKSVMDIMILSAVPEGAEAAPPAPRVWLEEDQDFTVIEELGAFGAFLTQDIDNVNGIMKGLANSQQGYVNFARKHESKIRHFYGCYEDAMGLSASDEIAALEKS